MLSLQGQTKTLEAALIPQLWAASDGTSHSQGVLSSTQISSNQSLVAFDAALTFPSPQRRVSLHNHRRLCAVRDVHLSGSLWSLVLCPT